jgi:DNA (cytosine-5)-methyltransferase 3A
MQPGGLFGDLESIIEQPKDKGILLKDILESEVDDKYFVSEKFIDKINRSINGKKSFNLNDKSLCLAAGYFKQGRDNQYIVHNMMPRSSTSGKGGTGQLSRADGKTDTGSTNAIEIKDYGNKRLNQTIKENKLVDGCLIDSYNKTIHIDKSITISTRVRNSNSTHLFTNSKIRRLTPIECERLQTVKDNYTNHVSDSQRYKMLGNGWTVDVIAHIFSYMKL